MTPERTCIGCRRRDDQSALVRLVRREDLVVDGTTPRLPGRGAYVHRGCLGLAVSRQAVRRAFRAPVTLDPRLEASAPAR
ncbi:hypothetical protein BCR15_09260 [Tessaracoccus lapidicaptus]|uniref:Uncharacterized protein n=1 Tax=Tessaracoccus lapidicaptus TaxID=1427523 RepID=A0A1C0AIB1_9ACTN|nr:MULTISPECIES: DUF448 domain-containing protein [Tessaracoccus]AQX16824.1 hypothetical protein BKM78_13560 [Tessaracoccus sp. T2.5-30]OCL31800.1 hypothetical protein BCR15_09260 [Tessaracoccus lapidicaptus]VEP41607.1 hypothetical protein TLA_TLA_02731 [Tessaracoccus lapidicaptus]